MVCVGKYFISEITGDAGLREHASLATVIFTSFTLPIPLDPASTTVTLEYVCQRDWRGGQGRGRGEQGWRVWIFLFFKSDVFVPVQIPIVLTLDMYCIG